MIEDSTLRYIINKYTRVLCNTEDSMANRLFETQCYGAGKFYGLFDIDIGKLNSYAHSEKGFLLEQQHNQTACVVQSGQVAVQVSTLTLA